MGMAKAHEISPPLKTRIAIFLPTIYPTATRAGDKSEPKPKRTCFPFIVSAAAPSRAEPHMVKPC